MNFTALNRNFIVASGSTFFVLVVFFTIWHLRVIIRINSISDGTPFASGWYQRKQKGDRKDKVMKSPWEDVPQFEVYLRMCSIPRFLHEYNRWFLKGYKQNFPPERWTNSLVIGMDNESKRDHIAGENMSLTWPFPRIYYHDPATDETIYLKSPRYRGFWDQFYPERYIKSDYVGYADTDTFFSSMVTPGSLFEDGKPIIIGRVGQPNVFYWPKATVYLLGHKEVAQCMSYFPVIFKVQHIVELRYFVAKRFGKSFDRVFPAVFKIGFNALCQFSVFCNYVWQYHRDEYVFRFQLSPDNTYRGIAGNWQPGMESLQKVKEVNLNNPERWFPAPRIAVHGRYIKTRQMKWIGGEMDEARVSLELHSILRESFCYIVGFDQLPECCKAYNRSQIFHYLYQFEYWSWSWHERAIEEQNKYLEEARQIINYQHQLGQPLFGIQTKEFQCPELE